VECAACAGPGCALDPRSLPEWMIGWGTSDSWGHRKSTESQGILLGLGRREAAETKLNI